MYKETSIQFYYIKLTLFYPCCIFSSYHFMFLNSFEKFCSFFLTPLISPQPQLNPFISASLSCSSFWVRFLSLVCRGYEVQSVSSDQLKMTPSYSNCEVDFFFLYYAKMHAALSVSIPVLVFDKSIFFKTIFVSLSLNENHKN